MEILGIVGIGISVFFAGANCAIFCIIKFNDLRHLEKSVSDLTETLKETNKNLIQNGKDLAELKGKCKANHG